MSTRAIVFLAVDPGHKKSGVAVGNNLTNGSSPLEVIKGDEDTQLARLLELCEHWRPQAVIFGLPEELQAKKAHRYAKQLAARLGKASSTAIEFVDESYSTQAARIDERARSLASNDVDAVAACLLAEDFLSSLAKK